MRQLACVLLLGLVPVSLLIAQQSATPPPGPQTTVPIFRTGVDAVLVDFTVVDRDGRFVRDLTQDDVEVFEDKRRQTVTAFSHVDIPIEPDRRPRFANAIVDRDSVSNIDGDGRLYLIALDDIHLHPLRAPVARAVARQFVERNIGVNDRAALVAMSGRGALAREFTGNKQQLLAAIDKLSGRYGPFGEGPGSWPPAGPGGTTTLELPRGSRLPPDSPGRMGAIATFHYLESLAKWMESIDGRRKSVVFISEGFSADLPDDLEQSANDVASSSLPPVPADSLGTVALSDDDRGSSLFEGGVGLSEDAIAMRDVVVAAARANVSIYTIDPRGQPGGRWTTINPGPGLDSDDLFSNAQKAGQQVLYVLATETGGFSLQHSNDFTAAYERIVKETSSYYVLGYTSDNSKRDGKFRRIQLRTKRPGLRIRARTGYVAKTDKPAKQEPLPAGWFDEHRSLVQSPVQAAGLPLRMTAAPFRDAAGKSSVAVIVEARGEDLKSRAVPGDATDAFTVVVLAADPDGKTRATGRGRFERTAQSAQIADRQGVRFVSRLPLKPGRYALRVAASDGSGMAAGRGSVYFDLEVPDFSKGPVAMSGVLLGARSASRRMTIGFDKSSAEVLNGPPTATREFDRDEEVTTMVGVYGNRKGPAGIAVTTSVRKPDGTVVFNNRQNFDASRMSSFPGVTHSARIPLRDLTPGDYLLTIEAASGAVAEKASRQIVFSVR